MVVLLISARAGAADHYPDIRGSWTGWSCVDVSLAECKASGQYEQNFTVSAENFKNGAVTIAGNGQIGQIAGDVLTISWPESGGYLSTDYYTISPCGDSMSGTFSDNYGRSGDPIYVTKVGEAEEEEEDAEDRSARASRAELETKTCKLKVRISGTVLRRVCAEKGCDGLHVVPVAGQQVELIGKKRSYETQTNDSGEYRFRVKRGKYRVHLLGTTKKVEPDSHTVNGSDDVGHLDFTLCKMPGGYGGKVPGCDLVKVEGKATDYYDAPVSGPAITSDTDTATVKDGRFTIYATRGSGTLDEHRLLAEARPGDVEAVTVPTSADVNQAEVKFLPQIKYRLGLSKRGRMFFEAWNMPATMLGSAPSVEGSGAPPSYYFEAIGTNRTSPANLICSLTGGTQVKSPGADEFPDGATLFENLFVGAEAAAIKTSDGTPEDPRPTYVSQFCEATYYGLIKDSAGNVLARAAFPGKGLFKPLSPNE